MHSVKVLSAIAAFASVASAATCTKDIHITEPTQVIDCDGDVVNANIIVDKKVSGIVSIEGPKQIKGDLVVQNVPGILGLSSTSINAIGGTFTLRNLELFSNLQMTALRSVDTVLAEKLNQLSKLSFGTDGVTSAKSITITDTFISDLSGISLATVDSLDINNNPKLTSFVSDLKNVTTKLSITENGNNFAVKMPMLESVKDVELSNIKGFECPKLSVVTGSLRFTDNALLTSYSAPNLTKVGASLTFNENKKLTNLTFPALMAINGDLTVQNNTILKELEGFPKLETVAGAILLTGAFDKVELPKLKDVQGTVTVSSTTEISDFCKTFNDEKDSGAIRAEVKCTSNNKKASSGDADGGDETTEGSGSSSGSSGDDDGSFAGMNNVNFALLGLAGVAAVAQLM